jgi:hypothetical protein
VPWSPTWGTVTPAVEETIIMREGSCREPDFERRGVNLTLVSFHLQSDLRGRAYSLAKLNTPLTFKSNTFLLLQSGVGSNGPPQVAPALHTRMSSCPSLSSTFLTSFSMSSVSATFAAMPTALPLILGSLLRRVTAWSMPSAPPFLRAEIMTVRAPARRNAVAVWRPRPRDPMTDID